MTHCFPCARHWAISLGYTTLLSIMLQLGRTAFCKMSQVCRPKGAISVPVM